MSDFLRLVWRAVQYWPLWVGAFALYGLVRLGMDVWKRLGVGVGIWRWMR